MTLSAHSVTDDDTPPQYGDVVPSPILPPEHLAGARVWVAWTSVPREGKLPRKLPAPVPGGNPTSVADLTAGTYAEAYAHMRDAGATGIGLVLGVPMSSGFCAIGVDLDSCRNDQTGAIDPWALSIISTLGAYAEISPSQTGVKVFGLVTEPELAAIEEEIAESKMRRGSRQAIKWAWATDAEHPPAIELFTQGRWFVFTGLHLLGTPEIGRIDPARMLHLISHDGPEFKRLDPGKAKPEEHTGLPTPTNDNPAPSTSDTARPDKELWRRIEAAAETRTTAAGFELKRLLRGDVAHLTDRSRSGIAMALGGALLRAGFPPDEMEVALREFGATAGWAAEQDDHDGRGFERIVENAAEAPPPRDPRADLATVKLPAGSPTGSATLPAEPANRKRRGTQFLSRTEILNMPPPAWLYPGFVPKEGLVFSAGPPKSLKSFTAMLMAQCAINVAPWLGIEPAFTEPLHVAYWLGEGHSGSNVRLSAIETEYGFLPSDNLAVLSSFLSVDDVIEHYAGKRLDIFFVDTLHRWVSALGLDENSAKDMGFAISELDRVREALNCLVIVIHHTGLSGDKRMRGSSALLGAADGLLMSTKTLPGVAIVECTELKEGEPGEARVVRLKKIGASAVAVLAEELSPMPSGLPSAPKGEIEVLITEILESLMPTGKPPVPPRGAAAPLPADVMTAGIATNGVLVSSVREEFIKRRPGTRRDMKSQAFTRGLKALQSKKLVLIVGQWMRPTPVYRGG